VNLIPLDEVPALPNDLLIGWDKISDHDVTALNFLDKEFLEKDLSENRRKEHVSSRKLFSDLLGELNISNSTVELKKMELGKPFGQLGDKILHTSFSHSADWVVCAMSLSLDIGIDCEPMQRKVNPRIFERILDNTEKYILEEVSHLSIWTMKEAVVKCIGTGIRTSLQKYPLMKNGDRFYVEWENSKINIVPFEWDNHQLAIAWRE
jgi:phosphopantetheinyl transferase